MCRIEKTALTKQDRKHMMSLKEPVTLPVTQRQRNVRKKKEEAG